MTTLQKQLAALRATKSNELDLRAQKSAHSKSLLFDSPIAAAQSFEVIYQLCHEGFEDICALDSRFSQYQRNLFSSQSRYQERENMTRSENDELDVILDSFLGLVGASLLLKPAQKAVEWLVRRFRIHLQNTDQFVLAFLPYHSTPLFLTVLTLLPTTLSPNLKFLHRYISTLQNPPREALVQAAIHNPAFFNAFNQYVLGVTRAKKQHSSLISLWATVMVQGVDGILSTAASGRLDLRLQREDDLLTRLFPILNEALTLKRASDLVLGCYMIVIVLVGKANVNEESLNALMCAITRSWSPDVLAAGVSCLALIAEQRHYAALPRAVSKAVLKIENLADILGSMSRHQPVESLALGLAEALMLPGGAEGSGLLHNKSVGEFNEEAHIKSLRNFLGSFGAAIGVSAQDGSQSEVLVELQTVSSDHASGKQLKHRSPATYHRDAADLVDEAVPDGLLSHGSTTFDREIAGLQAFTEVNTLTSSNHDGVARFLRLFEHAASDPDRLRRLLSSHTVAGADATEKVFSLLLYIWTASDSSLARQVALETATKRLSMFPISSASVQSPAFLGLVAMSDGSRRVRAAAAAFLSTLSQRLEEQTVKGVTNKTSHDGVLDSSFIFDGTVSDKDLSLFLNLIVGPGVEECIADASVTGNRLRQALGLVSTSEVNDHHGNPIKLRSSQKSTVFAAFCRQVLQSESRRIRLRILTLLNRVERVAGQPRSKYLTPIYKQYVIQLPEEEAILARDELGVEEYEREILAVLHPGDSDAISFVTSLAVGEISHGRSRLRIAALQRLQTLWPSVPCASQKSLAVSFLPKIGSTGSAIEASYDQRLALLRSLPLPIDVLLSLMDEVLGQIRASRASASKRIRTQGGPPIQQDRALDQSFVAPLTLIVELAESSTYKASIQLFHSLFEILRESGNVSVQIGSELGYIVNTSLQCLWSIMRSLQQENLRIKLDTSIVRADLLVDCVRSTSSPQARNAALLLLAALSERIPQEVLHSVMPVFTMISSTTVRQSDDFSAHVVDQTIRKVVPMLALKLREEQQDLVLSTSEILSNFAAAFEHIPPHRRRRLFALLASSLGPEQSLFAVIATLVDQFPADNDVKEFCSTLFIHFDSTVSLATIYRYLLFINDGLLPVKTLFRILSKHEYDDSGRDAVIVEHVRMAKSLLRNHTFTERLRKGLRDPETALSLRQYFAQSFKAIVEVSHRAHPLLQADTVQLLEQLLLVFPFNDLTTALGPLLDHQDQDLCKAAITTIEKRIKTIKQTGGETKEAIVGLLRRLALILADGDKQLVKPFVLACINSICEKFGKVDPEAVAEAMQVVISQQCLLSSDSFIRTLALHCLASAIEVLGNDFIPLLSPALDAAVSCLQSSLDSKDARLHNAAFAFLIAVGGHVPFMMSKSLLPEILRLSSTSAVLDIGLEAAESRKHFARAAASRLDTALLGQAMIDVWDVTISKGPEAVEEQIALAKAILDSQPKGVISHHARTVFLMLLKMLDLRGSAKPATLYLSADVERLEQALAETFTAFVLKINDSIFKPFFSQLLDWSSTPLAQVVEDRQSRTMTLFNIARALSNRLKSIFTPYFGGLAHLAVEILSDTTSAISNSQILRGAIVRCLTSSFMHDRSDFWQAPTRFDAISVPLVSQLSLTSPLEAEDAAILAVTELAVTAASSDNHKALNGLIMKLFRSDRARTRLIAVNCQRSLTSRLGDEWLANLPEMLPYISELQEDDDERVERETHRWINTVEEILGESLRSMLQ